MSVEMVKIHSKAWEKSTYNLMFKPDVAPDCIAWGLEEELDMV